MGNMFINEDYQKEQDKKRYEEWKVITKIKYEEWLEIHKKHYDTLWDKIDDEMDFVLKEMSKEKDERILFLLYHKNLKKI